jgi:PEP-CTERM motif
LVQTVHWWGAYANNDIRADSFTLRFFSDVAGNPAVAPFVEVSSLSVTRTATNLLDNIGDPVYEYQTTLARPVPLDGAASYYVSLVNTTGDWDWVGSGPGTHWARQDDASAWLVSNNPTDFAFELIGTPVPEPATRLLLAIGTLGVIGWAWRRHKVAMRLATTVVPGRPFAETFRRLVGSRAGASLSSVDFGAMRGDTG